MAERRIVLFHRVSADGYFADAGGGLDWALPDPELDGRAVERLPQSDAILLGRKTYQMFASFWPRAVSDAPDAPDPNAPRRTPEIRALAVWLNQARKWVFSRTLKEATWNNSRVLPEVDPRVIEDLKRQPGGQMMLFGSGSIAAQLSEHRLIDEYQLVVNPLLLGQGRPGFPGLARTVKLELIESRATSSGNVMLRYQRQ